MMMRLVGWVTSAALALGGCATTGKVAEPRMAVTSPTENRSITYSTTPCHRFCPVYTVTVGADGAGVFTGIRNTAMIGERRFVATRAQAAEFFNRLQPYLPSGELLLSGPGNCKTYATDPPSTNVKWTSAAGAGHLLYDHGCDREEHRTLAGALRTAPQALPIAELIGQR